MAASSTGGIGGSTPIFQDPSTRVYFDEEDINQELLYDKTILDFAHSILGRGYNSDSRLTPDSRLLGPVLNPSNTDVEISEVMPLEAYHLALTTDQVVEELKRNFQLNFSFSNPTVSIAPFLQRSTQELSDEIATKIVYITTYVHYHRCRYKDVNALKLTPGCDLSSKRCVGDSFVRSIWVYTGYRVLVEMTLNSTSKSSLTKWNVGGSASGWSCTLGGSFEHIKTKLKKTKVREIKLTRHSYGRYPTNHVMTHNIMSVDDLDKMLAALRDEYLNNANRIRHPKYLIEGDCLKAYTKCPLLWHTPSNPNPVRDSLMTENPETSVSRPVELEPDFEALAFRIENYLGEGASKFRKQILGKLNHILLLRSLEKVFSEVFSKIANLQLTSGPSSIVIGKTGAGKSSLIRYLKGEDFSWNESYDSDGAMIIQLIPRQEGEGILRTGAFGSVTVGYEVVPGYIDTAGLLDNRGKEFDVCNSNAIKMATKLIRPERVIFVVEPGIFKEERLMRLFDFIDLASSVISNLTGEDEFLSVYFVVNDKDRPMWLTQERIKGAINRAKRILRDSLNEILPQVPNGQNMFSRGFNSIFGRSRQLTSEDLTNLEEIEKLLIDKHITETTYKILIKTYNQVNILNRMLKQENFIAADITSPAAREKIHQWEKNSPGIAPESFTMGDLVENGEEIFNIVINNLAGYFNSLYIRKTELENNLIPATKKRIVEVRLEIEDVKSPEELNKKLEKYATEIQRLNVSKLQKEAQLREETQTREEFENELDFITQKPDRRVTSRSWWASADWSARKYRISYKDEERDPIQKVEHEKTAKPHRKWPLKGRYFDKKKEHMSEGRYSVKFFPKWHNYDGDCDAKIYVYFMKKHLPKYGPAIQLMKEAENTLSLEIAEISNDIQRKERTQKLSKKIKETKVLSVLNRLENDLQTKIKDLEELESELEKITTELSVYKSYCGLIQKIIHYLGLHAMGDEQKISTIREFYNNFRYNDASQPGLSSSSHSCSSNTPIMPEPSSSTPEPSSSTPEPSSSTPESTANTPLPPPSLPIPSDGESSSDEESLAM